MDSLFAQLNMDPIVFLGVGAVLALVGIFKIIGNGISFAIWIILLILGVSSVNYGMKESGVKLSPEIAAQLSKVVEPGKTISQGAMKSLCEQIVKQETGSKEWCETQRKKPKSEWSPTDALDFAKKCML